MEATKSSQNSRGASFALIISLRDLSGLRGEKSYGVRNAKYHPLSSWYAVEEVPITS
jgi:hypothetical protein